MMHTLIYSGKRGLGKHSAALALAKELTGANVGDIIEVSNERYGITDKQSISAEAVRAARREAYITPGGDRKVFIINNAEELTATAQNALLKVLEEPPSYCLFILVTQNEQLLLPTILSRSEIKYFAPKSDTDIKGYLTKKYGSGTYDHIAELSQGREGLAEELLKLPDLEELLKKAKELVRAGTSGSSAERYRACEFFVGCKERRELVFDLMERVAEKSLLNYSLNNDKIKMAQHTQLISRLARVRTALANNASCNMQAALLFMA